MQIGGWTTGEMLDEVYEHTTDARVEEVLARAEVGGIGHDTRRDVETPKSRRVD